MKGTTILLKALLKSFSVDIEESHSSHRIPQTDAELAS